MGPHGWENQPNQKNQALPRGGAFPGNNKSRNQGRVTTLHTVGRPSTTGDHSDGNSMTLNLMGDQVQRLLTFLEHENSEWLSSKVLDEFFWILDSGASNHMTGDLAFLHDVKEVILIQVILPNGTTTTATKKGRVALCEKITLFDVLFVPNLACNLISIPQLTLELNCQILFTNQFCVIQDHISMMPIGMGKNILEGPTTSDQRGHIRL